MRREAAVLVVVGLGMSFSSCQGPSRPACPAGRACMALPKGETVSGCDDVDANKGSALVKVRVKLKGDPHGSCSVDSVEPERVCVLQGGVIRWRIHNNCNLAPGSEAALELAGIRWLTEACDPVLKPVKPGSDKKNELLCNVPDDTTVDRYPYEVEVKVEAQTGDEFDPWIEVKRGG